MKTKSRMQTDAPKKQVVRLASAFSTIMGLVSLGLLAFCIMAHQLRPATLTAATICPLFLWITAGLFVTVLAGKWRFPLVCCWLVAGYFLGDAPESVVRGLRAGSTAAGDLAQQPTNLRIVSLNCRSDPQAAAEVGTWRPDIVLFQESPPRKVLEDLAQTWFGESGNAIWSRDVSIVARGTMEVTDPFEGDKSNYIFMRLRLTSGEQLGIVSVRLMPIIVRPDIWHRDCWEYYRDNHRQRREELAQIMRQLNQLADLPLVVGGDFNTPARDSVFLLMHPRLHDSFIEAGQGWGKTVTNEWPLHRIDQIWLSNHLQAVSVTAQKTAYSDHRMVVCDVVLPQR